MQRDKLDFESTLKALQMIHLTLISGILVFVSLPFFLGGEKNRGDDSTLKVAICTAVCVGTTVASVLVPGIIIQQGVRKYCAGLAYTTSDLFGLALSSHVIRMAFLEGSALLGCLMFFVSRDPVFLVFPGVFLILGFILFPTRTRLLSLIQNMEEKIRQGL